MNWTQVLFLLIEISDAVRTDCVFSEPDFRQDEVAGQKHKVKSLIIRLSPGALQLYVFIFPVYAVEASVWIRHNLFKFNGVNRCNRTEIS